MAGCRAASPGIRNGTQHILVPPIAPKPINEDGSIAEDRDRIPDELLEGQFGPAVHDALATLKREMAKTKQGGQSDLMDLLIVYEWKDLFSEFTVDPVDIEQGERG